MLFCLMCAKIQDLVTSHLESKLLYQHIPIIKLYTATSILMCAHGCNRKLCNTHIFSYNTNKRKIVHIKPKKKEMN